MKRRLCISHAALSAVHWVLGIGDRHLNNLMVDQRTGAVVGIDFGHAFGTAVTALAIPELIPFRLTEQLEQAIGEFPYVME